MRGRPRILGGRHDGVRLWHLRVLVRAGMVAALMVGSSVSAKAALDPLTDRLFTDARAHHVWAVYALRPKFAGKIGLWGLALFVADPAGNAKTFVKDFPTTRTGVRDQYGYLWIAGVLGGLNPYGALGTLAINGNSDALRRLTEASGLVPDGFIGQELQNDLSRVARESPAAALSAITSVAPNLRVRITAASITWCQSGTDILHVRASGDAAEAQHQISATITANCPTEN